MTIEKLSPIFAERVAQLVEHLANNVQNAHMADLVEKEALKVLRSYGAVHRNTPLISHGMQEYSQPLARFNLNNTQVGLRHSQQFDKQLIVLSTGEAYCQRSGAFRPGDSGKFHTPYFNLMDFEFPFNESDIDRSAVCAKMADLLATTITTSLRKCGLKVAEPIKITHAESMQEYNTGDPYLDPKGNDVALAMVFNPPLLSDFINPNTSMNPVMQPIFKGPDEQEAFIAGKMTSGELSALRVHGFDAIISCPKLFTDGETPRGLEVGGGGVRINSAELLAKIASLVRADAYETYLPLIAVLEHFQNTGKYTAGGAIGLDRLCMVAAGVDQITKIQSTPWHHDGTPNFCNRP